MAPRLRVDTELYIDDATGTATGLVTNAISTRVQDTQLTSTGGSGDTVVTGALDVQGTLTSGSVELSTELRAPTVRARPTDDYLTLTGGTQGTYLTTLYTASAIRADNGIVSSPTYLELIGGSVGVRAQGDLQVVSTVNSGDVTAEVLNLAAAGNARLLVACNAGSAELTASSAGGVQLYAQDQAIFLRTAATGPANLIVEANTGGANDGWYRRTDGSQKRTLGFIAKEVQETGPVGQALCGKLVELGELVTLDCAACCGVSARGSRPAWRPWRRRARSARDRKWTRRT